MATQLGDFAPTPPMCKDRKITNDQGTTTQIRLEYNARLVAWQIGTTPTTLKQRKVINNVNIESPSLIYESLDTLFRLCPDCILAKFHKDLRVIGPRPD